MKQADFSDRILLQALVASNTIQGAEFKTIALSGIAEAYLNAGQSDLAAPPLTQSLQFTQAIDNPTPASKAAALERVASLYDRISQPDRALQILQSIPVADYSFTTLIALVNRDSEAGQVDQALELLQTLQPADKAVPLSGDRRTANSFPTRAC